MGDWINEQIFESFDIKMSGEINEWVREYLGGWEDWSTNELFSVCING